MSKHEELGAQEENALEAKQERNHAKSLATHYAHLRTCGLCGWKNPTSEKASLAKLQEARQLHDVAKHPELRKLRLE
jgi:hypothetical protein